MWISLAIVGLITSYCGGAKASQSCEIIKGELNAWDGSPSLRIYAGQHLIGIVDSAAHPLPPAITNDVDFDHSVTGLFTVCKLGQAEPNGMIYAWLKKAQNLNIVPAPSQSRADSEASSAIFSSTCAG
jgi:hypothetical protein